MSQFDFEEVIKSWMDNPAEFIPKEDKAYPISWFREPFSLLAAMFFNNMVYLIVENSRLNGLL